MTFENYIREIYNSKQYNSTEKPFRDRVEFAIAFFETGKLKTKRTLSTPCFLTDLGVRKSASPRVLSKKSLNILKLEEFSDEEIQCELKNAEINSFGTLIDLIVLLTGKYEPIKDIIHLRKNELLMLDDYETLLNVGTLLASIGDKEAILYFNSIRREKSDNVSFIIAQHRSAVTQLKRGKQFNVVYNKLNEMMNFEELNSTEELLIIALINNLTPLIQLIENKKITTKEHLLYNLILKSASLHCTSIISSVCSNQIKSQAARYRSQININRAQLLNLNNENSKAVEILEINLTEVENYANEYLCEALACLSYSYYINKEYELAIKYGRSAITEYEKIGDFQAIIATREVLIGSYSKIKKEEESIMQLNILDKEMFWFE